MRMRDGRSRPDRAVAKVYSGPAGIIPRAGKIRLFHLTGNKRGLAVVFPPMEASAPTVPPSFDHLMLPHLDAAYNLARWLLRNDQDAEDAVQEACLRAWRAFDRFRGRHPGPRHRGLQRRAARRGAQAMRNRARAHAGRAGAPSSAGRHPVHRRSTRGRPKPHRNQPARAAGPSAGATACGTHSRPCR